MIVRLKDAVNLVHWARFDKHEEETKDNMACGSRGASKFMPPHAVFEM